MPFFGANGSLTQDNNLFWKNASSSLGIGTLNPQAALQVGNTFAARTLSANSALISGDLEVQGTSYLGGNIVISTNQISFDNASSTVLGQPMTFATNGAQRMIILANGNIGIGTTSPSQLLTIGNSDQFTVSSSGNVAIAGDLNINAGKFTVASTTGNTIIAGTASIGGNATLLG
ncbi:MAG: hypothetical protein NT091_01595, partial [Candidatus Falkowbacteria bacterium]|nr:hypothetical protein [Candidatus Falkowbacteria bacterium]